MNAAVAQERWQGQIIDGKFTLLDWLGGSPHSAVLRTEVKGASPQPAAIKLIRAESCNAAQQIARWKESASLSHSNLLRIFDSGYCQINGAHWIYVVTEYAEENLDQVLPVRSLSPTEISEILPPILEALAYLHAKRMVHGRMKPSNIFAINNQLKLSIDSVRLQSEPAREQQLTAFDGPEIDSSAVTGALDVWSLGMTIVTGFNQRPVSWSRSSHVPPAVPKEVPPPFQLIASECLRMNPVERCSLQRIKDLSRQAVPVAKPVPAAQPKRKLVLPLTAAIAVLIVVLAIVLKHSPEKPATQAVPAQATADAPATPSPSEMVAKPSPAQNATHSKAVANHAPSSEIKHLLPGSDGVVEQVLPSVPQSARNTIHGKVRVVVKVSVTSDGEVSSAKLASAGPSQYFARLALEASRKWKFKPQNANGQTRSEWLIEYKFGRASTEVSPRPRS